MATHNALKLFFSDFDLQMEIIEEIYAKLETKKAKSENEGITVELVESIGYWLHNLYSGYEDLFKLIASFWENSIEDAAGYHIQLLKRMRLTIKGVRPALINDDRCYEFLDELRAFRHVFRHAYSYGVDNERIFFLLKRTLKKKSEIRAEIKRFRQEIEASLES